MVRHSLTEIGGWGTQQTDGRAAGRYGNKDSGTAVYATGKVELHGGSFLGIVAR